MARPSLKDPPVSVSPINVLVMLFHLFEAAKDPAIGFNDADYTKREMQLQLSKRAQKIKKSMVESALYCCNLMNEDGKFWHPQGKSFETFISEIEQAAGKRSFDKFWNLLGEQNNLTRPE